MGEKRRCALIKRDGTKVPAAVYADYFWLNPGDAAILSGPTAL